MVALILGDQNGPLPFEEIQGFVLRGYNFPKARHFFVNLPQVAAGRSLIAALAPLVTTAAPWPDNQKPPTCLNVGVTAAGLELFGVKTAGNFPAEFSAGAAQRATTVGDTGDSGPSNWTLSLGSSDPASQPHVVLSLYAQNDDGRRDGSAEIDRICAAAGVRTIGTFDSDDLPMSFVHFNYADGISEPNVVGAPVKKTGDTVSPVPAGEFVLGYPNQNGKVGYKIPEPMALTMNGSYSAFRILEQNVDAFEAFLDESAKSTGVARDIIHAKLCGRWRNGSPLVLNPDAPLDVPVDRENDFNYDANDDERGGKCPLGSHIRRSHPRDSKRVRGGPTDGFRHRIMRRAMPYGPEYKPNDGVARGLVGHFICGDLRTQFEFVMKQWINGDSFGTRNGIEPMIGANDDPAKSVFLFSVGDEEPESRRLEGFARFTTTRGGAYLFLPSISGMRYLAAG